MNASADLLKLLAPGNAARAASPQKFLQQLASSDTFQSILEKARAGEVTSGIRVSAPQGSGIALTQDQVTRLSAAADIAEAHGAGRAVFLIDGQALRMDVGTRTIIGPVDASQTGVLTDIDAIVNVAPTGAAQAASLIQPPAAQSGMNLSLLRALSGDRAQMDSRAA